MPPNIISQNVTWLRNLEQYMKGSKDNDLFVMMGPNVFSRGRFLTSKMVGDHSYILHTDIFLHNVFLKEISIYNYFVTLSLQCPSGSTTASSH